MHKGTKILGKILLSVVLFFLLLPLALSLLLSIPWIQNCVVDEAAAWASRRLGTRVSIGRVDVGWTGNILLDNFYVEDFQQDTLLYIGHAAAFLPRLGLTGDGLCFTRGRLRDVKLYLRETPEREMNIRQVVLSMSNPDRKKKGNFRLDLRNAQVENMTLLIERLAHRNPLFGVDYGNMRFENLDLSMREFVIDGHLIMADVASLSAREQSGFVLEHLDGRFYLTKGGLGFEQAHLRMPHSDLHLKNLALMGNAWTDFKNYISEVEMLVEVEGSVATDDIAYFAPSMRRWQTRFTDTKIDFEGKVDDFRAKIYRGRVGDRTSLRAEGRVQGLPEFRTARFNLRIPTLRTTATEALLLSRNIARLRLNESTYTQLRRMGHIDLSGHFNGSFDTFEGQAGISTELGSANLTAEMMQRSLPDSETAEAQPERILSASASATQFDLGTFLDQRPLVGRVSVAANMRSVVQQRIEDTYVAADITNLAFNDYIYDSIRVAGRLRNRTFNGRIQSKDEALDARVAGLLDWRDTIPRYDLTAQINRLDLHATHFNRRDSISELATRVVVKAGGRSLDDLNGRIQLADASYRYNDKAIEANSIVLMGENSAESKFVQLHSDFADATFRSKSGYQEIFDYLRRSAWRYLPLIGRGAEAEWQQTPPAEAVANDFSLLDVKIHHFNPIADAIATGLQIADGSSMQLLFNPVGDRLSFHLASDYIERQQMLLTHLRINASNKSDSLTLYASAEDLYAGILHLPQFSLTGGARQGNMQLSAGFTDTTQHTSARIGLRAMPIEATDTTARGIRIDLLPSHLSQGEKRWQIGARNIEIDPTRFVVDRFIMRNEDQLLRLNGIASRHTTDSLTLRLHRFDLAPFLRFADRMGYRLSGQANGEAIMSAVLGGGRMTADIEIDSMTVNSLAAPPLHLTSRWNSGQQRVGLALTNRMQGDTVLRGYYAPKQRRYYAHLVADSINMKHLDPILEGVVSGTRGRANADLTLSGEGRQADLRGTIRVRDLQTKVDFTQVEYRMPEAEMQVHNNRFTVSDVPIYDPEGRSGRFSLDLSLQHLSNIAYEVRVKPEQMLVLNTTQKDNDHFYGRIFASGLARIRGDKGLVKMDITARTENNSRFYMPLSDKSNISNAEFVTFVQPELRDSTDQVAERRRRFERHRRRQAAANRMEIDLEVDVRPNVEVEMMVSGSPIRARGEGLLSLNIAPRSNIFEMYGDYSIMQGSYDFSLQNILSKRFVIEEGSMIQWTGDPVDARLNIDALYKLKTSLQPLLEGTADNVVTDRSVPVECGIHIGDRLSNPSVSFSVHVPDTDPETQSVISTALSTPESVDMQFLYLLIFNNFMAETGMSGTAGIGSTASAASGLEFLSNQLSRLLSVSDYNLVIRYRPKTEMASDEVDFGLSKSLINNRLLVEVEGNYLIDNKQAVNSSMSNFMGEAHVTYLVDRSGALRLKAFTQTIDRFDENQGMQETGVGISYKEDFDNFRDLRRRIKERFTSKRRKERKERERLAQEAAVQQTEQVDAQPQSNEQPVNKEETNK